MLRPSYAELMDILNKDSEGSDEVTSRYTIVIATAKRARQLIDGDEPMVKEIKGKPVSTAVEELRQNKIKVVPEGEGTVLNLKKNNTQNAGKESSHEDDEPLFDYTTVETVSQNSKGEDLLADGYVMDDEEY